MTKDKRAYNVEASFMVMAETRAKAIEKIKKMRTPKGASVNWIIQAKYTDSLTDEEIELNDQWTTHVPRQRDHDGEWVT